MLQRGVKKRLAAGRFRGIEPRFAMDIIPFFGQRVMGLQVRICDGPGRGDASGVFHLLKVPFAQA